MDLKLIEKIAQATYGSSFPNDHVKREYMEIIGAMFNRADPKDIRKALTKPSGKVGLRIFRKFHSDGAGNFIKDGKVHRRFTTRAAAEAHIANECRMVGDIATYEIM